MLLARAEEEADLLELQYAQDQARSHRAAFPLCACADARTVSVPALSSGLVAQFPHPLLPGVRAHERATQKSVCIPGCVVQHRGHMLRCTRECPDQHLASASDLIMFMRDWRAKLYHPPVKSPAPQIDSSSAPHPRICRSAHAQAPKAMRPGIMVTALGSAGSQAACGQLQGELEGGAQQLEALQSRVAELAQQQEAHGAHDTRFVTAAAECESAV